MNKLNNVLLLNALSSGATGLFLLIDASWIAQLFEVSQVYPFQATGTFLLFFGVTVFLISRTSTPAKYTSLIIAADLCWVLASIALTLFPLVEMSPAGYSLILLVAGWVAAMAYLQYRAMKITYTI